MDKKTIQERAAELDKQVRDAARESLKRYIGTAWGVTHVQPMCPPESYTLKERLDFLKVNPHAFDPWFNEDTEIPKWLLCMLFWLSNKHPEKVDITELERGERIPRKKILKKNRLSYQEFMRRGLHRRCDHGK